MMEIVIPLFEDFSLKISPHPSSGKEYSTAGLQKGWLLCKSGEELSEEGVGFGVPVIQRGLTTVFPGKVDLETRRNGAGKEIIAVYSMNLGERIAGSDRRILRNDILYTFKNHLASLYRRFPPLRTPLTVISSALREMFRWRTVFEKSEYSSAIKIKYRITEGKGQIMVEADLTDMERDGVTEVVMMNEQGARYFVRYRDSGGMVLTGNKINGWDEVMADKASFVCDRHQVAFTLRQVPGARLFRGRELVGTRLAWAGFGYLLPPVTGKFGFDLRIEKVS
ncbi:MAG: hypothetical protein ABSB78_14095 [Bacteroidota bacterium]